MFSEGQFYDISYLFILERTKSIFLITLNKEIIEFSIDEKREVFWPASSVMELFRTPRQTNNYIVIVERLKEEVSKRLVSTDPFSRFKAALFAGEFNLRHSIPELMVLRGDRAYYEGNSTGGKSLHKIYYVQEAAKYALELLLCDPSAETNASDSPAAAGAREAQAEASDDSEQSE